MKPSISILMNSLGEALAGLNKNVSMEEAGHRCRLSDSLVRVAAHDYKVTGKSPLVENDKRSK